MGPQLHFTINGNPSCAAFTDPTYLSLQGTLLTTSTLSVTTPLTISVSVRPLAAPTILYATTGSSTNLRLRLTATNTLLLEHASTSSTTYTSKSVTPQLPTSTPLTITLLLTSNHAILTVNNIAALSPPLPFPPYPRSLALGCTASSLCDITKKTLLSSLSLSSSSAIPEYGGATSLTTTFVATDVTVGETIYELTDGTYPIKLVRTGR